MPLPRLLLVLLATLLSLALADQTLTIHAWPLGASSPQPLARVSYSPANSSARILSWNALADADADALVRVGLLNPEWTGILTSAAALSPEYKKTLVLHADRAGAVYAVGLGAEARGTAETDEVDVKVEIVKVGPVPLLNKPVVLDETGRLAGQEEPQKSFLQKYWWAIGLFLVLQVVAGGGKE